MLVEVKHESVWRLTDVAVTRQQPMRCLLSGPLSSSIVSRAAVKLEARVFTCVSTTLNSSLVVCPVRRRLLPPLR